MKGIKLGNTEFEGENNAYLLEREGTVALVDTGIATPAIRDDLQRGLEATDRSFSDVDIVLVTHWHYDHAGLASEVQDAGGATVYAHAADAPLISKDETAIEEMLAERHRRYEEWAVPESEVAELESHIDGESPLSGGAPTVEPLEDGDSVSVGNLELRVLHAPGHSAGLACYEFSTDDGAEAFVGDAVLPVYTPNVGGADVRVERPLEQYVETLRTIIDREYERVWPGHRDVIENPAARAREIIEHHRDRTTKILDILDEHGPQDAWTISAHLFGNLEGIHIMHGPGEVYAHVDHLERIGVVERAGDTYSLANGSDVDRGDLL